MNTKIDELFEIVKYMADERIDQVIAFAAQIAAEAESEITDTTIEDQSETAQQEEPAARIENQAKGSAVKPDDALCAHGDSLPCPHCGSSNVTRFGRKHGKQRFHCKDCGKTYVVTTGTIMSHSHMDEESWQQAIKDTVEGRPLRSTEQTLDVSHDTVFTMRHKILTALEQNEAANATVLSGESELDETYVLEDLKGKKLPEGYWRGPRKHGAKAKTRGISSEHVCIMTGIERGGAAYAVTLNLATPSKDEIVAAFHDHIAEGASIFCDGEKGYDVLYSDRNCDVTHTHAHGINTANGFHSFIKALHNRDYHGVATKYLNRYNALFAAVYRHRDAAFKKICGLLGVRFNPGMPNRAQLPNSNILNILTGLCSSTLF